MLTGTQQDRSALRWIRGELDQTLRQARNSLEDFVEGESDRLPICVDTLHHAHGVLEMVQVYGGAMLADEMEQLAKALSSGLVKRSDTAAEALMLGLVQLPAYLEKIEAGGADVPLALLPLMNDLRSARDAPLVSETSLFAPKLDAVIAAETVRPGSGNRELPQLIHERRSHFHRGLLSWIRGVNVEHSLNQIRDVLDVLNSAAGTARFRRLLDAAEALVVVLIEDDGAPAPAVKPLFGKIDRVFKQIIDQGEESAMLDFPVELLKNLLYYIARSNSVDPTVIAVRQAADLVNSFPESSDGNDAPALGGPDREMFAAVGDALGQDLRDVKDQLDLFMRSNQRDLSRVTGLAQPIQRIGDTLGMIGRGELRARLKHRCDELKAAETSGEMLSDERLMLLAGDLLFVESSLSNLDIDSELVADFDEPLQGDSQLLSAGEMQDHLSAAIDEAMVEMAQTKDAILQYLDKSGDNVLLDSVPSRLTTVAGVLQLLEMPEAGRLLNELKPYISDLASGEREPPQQAQSDALADVVIGAECYMQTALEPSDDRERILHYAEAALARLGLGSKAIEDEAESGASPVAEVAASGPDAEAPAEAEDAVAVETGVEDEPEASVTDTVAEGDLTSGGAETDADDGIDSEILEVFCEEADEELQVIQECYPAWRNDPEDSESLSTIRRSFHTLKGSGRLVGAENIGEFSWSIENLLNRVIEGTVAPTAELFGVMDEAVGVLPQLVAESRDLRMAGQDVSAVSERAFALAAGEMPASVEVVEPAGETAESPFEEMPSGPVEDESLATHAESESLPESFGRIASDAPTEDWSELEASSMQFDAVDSSSLESLPAIDEAASTELMQAADEQESAPDDLPAGQADESILTLEETADSDLVSTDATDANSMGSSLHAVFLSEVQSHLNVLHQFISDCRARSEPCPIDESIHRAMHTLHGSARIAGADSMAELAEALEGFGSTLLGRHRHVDGGALNLLERSHVTLSALAVHLDDSRADEPEWQSLRDQVLLATAQIGTADTAVSDMSLGQEAADDEDAPDPELMEIFLEEAKELLESLEGELSDWENGNGDPAPVARLQRTLHTMKGGARLAGISAVGDISHALESVFESVAEQRTVGTDALQALVRHSSDALALDIESLLAGRRAQHHPEIIDRLEDAAHGRAWAPFDASDAVMASELPAAPLEMNSQFLEDDRTVSAAPDESSELLEDELDSDSALLTDSQLLTDSELLSDSSFLTSGADEGTYQQLVGDASAVVHLPNADPTKDDESFVPRRPMPKEEQRPVAGSERIRVRSETLDYMVNNAGEVSIYRARLEQQNNTFAFNLGELQQTIDRLRSQLRDLELETEAQVLSRHEREGERPTDFDPLELDRYSSIQQLSRALSETVEDLSNLGQSLNDLSRDTDTLLLQQARVNTDLQDTLLRTRMVKFSSRVPRLERVVRQTSHSVGKQATLSVSGGGEDMDRAILERMMSPLEHLLRNAVSHGIEDSDTRVANGKSAQGVITLELAREGTDVVLTLSDDGAGLDRDRIRAKAVERGLIEADARIEDDDLYQMILQPGFSTAAELSQVSGRGVGMDVVLTEVKQLGGTLEIDSQAGYGTSFSIRLPFTLAITDSLLVTLGEEIYAVPHGSMDGVVRISLDELRAIYAGEQEFFRYADRDYSVRYLGHMLGTQTLNLSDSVKWLPMLLVRSGEHRVAIQVDGLLGNRQIVVKSVGAQLSTVRWFTGGTILADGHIAMILDVNSLVRIDSAQQPTLTMAQATPVNKGVSVMVVDDSITVRKVTSRLLERHNMQIVTAKDGVDAVTQLQDYHPDVMLLDIEMPRMDGFELARHMRSTRELADIPIIMITSRTGDKHRNRALELGVKRYLGKPYQEAELLENIYTVLADAAL